MLASSGNHITLHSRKDAPMMLPFHAYIMGRASQLARWTSQTKVSPNHAIFIEFE